MRRWSRRAWLIALGTAGGGLSLGCTMLHEAGIPGFERYVKDADAPLVADYQRRFQVDSDPAALNWLLSRRVRTGMSVAQINDILGESGERVTDDQELKAFAGQYLRTDVGYKWGPDANGRSVVLFFRDGRLVHFDPHEFAR